MDILTKKIESFGFDDIVTFCKEGHREDYQIDYKKDLPSNGLAKHFAAFSNSKGGLILIGVEENRITGIPIKWDGVNNDAKSIERIHQWASNVEPLPRSTVHVTEEKNGKVFILIRILEGDRTPYYVQNDSNLWVRTGNISTPIDLASPDYAELLFKRKEQADISRNIFIKQTADVYNAALRRAERERLAKIAKEAEDYKKKKEAGDPQPIIDAFAGGFHSHIYSNKLGSQASMCTIILQPFFPKEALLKPSEIKDRIVEIRDLQRTPRMYFPDLNVWPIPQGILRFDWGESDGQIDCHQIYASGLVYSSTDVLMVDHESKKKLIYLSHVLGRLFQVLKAASNFYQIAGYQGGVEGYLELANTEDISLVGFQHELFNRDLLGLMPSYQLNFSDLDTSKLSDPKAFQEFFENYVKEFFWSIGKPDLHESLIKKFLQDNQWLVT